MRPAFSSTRQAAAFALLLLVVLLAPAFAGRKFLPPREEIYSSIWWANGDFPYMDGQMFRERGGIDIIFMGSSHIWAAFNTPYVQEELAKQTGQRATVRTFGWGGPGYDEVYFVAKDLLEHRKLRLLVIDDDFNESDRPHLLAAKMFRQGDNAPDVEGLPAWLRAQYYSAAVAGMPRNLLSLARTNLPADLKASSYWEIHSRAESIPDQLGAITARIGFRSSPQAAPESFTNYVPETDIEPRAVCFLSPATRASFSFTKAGLPPMQLYFAQKLAALAKEHDCRLVVVHVPTFDERRAPFISTPVYWPEALDGDVVMLGIPPTTMFQGLADDEIRELYSDSVHLNENGQNYFTKLMTPALLNIYESKNQNP